MPGLELVRLTTNSTAAVAPNICSTHGLHAAGVPCAAVHNLTRLYQLSVNYKHTEHCRITAAVVTLLRARDNADNQDTSKSCKVNFPAETIKTALFTRTTITNKIFPRTTRQLFHVHVEGDPGTVWEYGEEIQGLFESMGKRSRYCLRVWRGWLQVLFCVGERGCGYYFVCMGRGFRYSPGIRVDGLM